MSAAPTLCVCRRYFELSPVCASVCVQVCALVLFSHDIKVRVESELLFHLLAKKKKQAKQTKIEKKKAAGIGFCHSFFGG